VCGLNLKVNKNMIIDITPNYQLFIQILFVLWVLRHILLVGLGVAQAEITTRDKYGAYDIISGIIGLLLVMWIVVK